MIVFDLVGVQHGRCHQFAEISWVLDLIQWAKEIISRKMSQNLNADEWTLSIFLLCFFTFSCCVLGTNGTSQTYSENLSGHFYHSHGKLLIY